MRVPAVLLVLVLLPGCLVKVADDEADGGDGEGTTNGPAGPWVEEVAMHDQRFEPSSLTVARNDTIHFFAQDATHSVQSTNGVYDQGDVAQGESVNLIANLAGTYTFQCRFHASMRMSLTVTA
jgi:plastocyanin